MLTWKKLATLIADMERDGHDTTKPVLIEFIVNHAPTLYGVVVQPFESESAVDAEIAVGDPVLKATN